MRRFLAVMGVMLMVVFPFMAQAKNALDWTQMPLPALEGGQVAPESLTGKVVLVVNTASFCGFTKQYQGLQDLWTRYRDRGLVVLGVPSNDFGAQEPGSEAEIKTFCEASFGVDFPMLSKQTVSGRNAHPFYRWAADQTGSVGTPKWNFHKLLVGRDGRLVDWFSTITDPGSEKLVRAIEGAL